MSPECSNCCSVARANVLPETSKIDSTLTSEIPLFFSIEKKRPGPVFLDLGVQFEVSFGADRSINQSMNRSIDQSVADCVYVYKHACGSGLTAEIMKYFVCFSSSAMHLNHKHTAAATMLLE